MMKEMNGITQLEPLALELVKASIALAQRTEADQKDTFLNNQLFTPPKGFAQRYVLDKQDLKTKQAAFQTLRKNLYDQAIQLNEYQLPQATCSGENLEARMQKIDALKAALNTFIAHTAQEHKIDLPPTEFYTKGTEYSQGFLTR